MEIRKPAEEDFRDYQAQDGITQKFELLIVLFAQGVAALSLTALEGLFVRKRTVGQRLHQQLLLAEGVTQCCLKRVESRL
jgi:hypothetical protein